MQGEGLGRPRLRGRCREGGFGNEVRKEGWDGARKSAREGWGSCGQRGVAVGAATIRVGIRVTAVSAAVAVSTAVETAAQI